VIKILSIPVISDKLERIFSGGRRMIIWDRMLFGLEIIEQTECTKSWIRSDIIKEYLF
jgi:hypothetical protein